nr:MAG TPA: hypothetical protein [Caudoviricetes sp.]
MTHKLLRKILFLRIAKSKGKVRKRQNINNKILALIL